MAGAEAGAVVAMKIFIEKDEVAPVRIALKAVGAAGYWPAATRIAKKNMNEPPGNFRGYLPEIGFGAGMGGALHFEIFAVVVVIFLQRFDEEIVHRKPDGPAPIRIPSKEASRGFRRLVRHAIRISVYANFARIVLVKARKGAPAVRRVEVRFVYIAAEIAPQLLAIRHGSQTRQPA